jgi:hypothetical protein
LPIGRAEEAQTAQNNKKSFSWHFGEAFFAAHAAVWEQRWQTEGEKERKRDANTWGDIKLAYLESLK